MHIDIGEWQVRSHRADDAESLARYANNRNVSRNLRDAFPFPYTLTDATEWLGHAIERSPESNWAIASATEVIGGIGLTFGSDVHRRSAEIGYWLGEPFWGRGIATAALIAVTEYAFAEHDLVRLHAGVFEWNPASARVLEKAGYVLEGRLRKSVTKDGQTIDQLLYARISE
ncbi:MAG: GNAT family protein [Chloroflexi bacterium]|nr:GNAT family protein [Chloroflexota bacterium]